MHGQVGLSLSIIIAPQTPAIDTTTNINCEHDQHPSYVRPIPMWSALTREAVTTSTGEAFHRVALPIKVHCTILLHIESV